MNRQFFLLIVIIIAGMGVSTYGITFTCSSAQEIQDALNNVNAGDTILIEPGTYTGTRQSINSKGCYFGSIQGGTSSAPITVRSAHPSNKAILTGSDTANDYVFYIYNGNYWIIQDLVFTHAQKGLVFDNSMYSKVIHCDVYGIGMEGIHLRDGSSNCTIDSCVIYNTGLDTPGYGEGVYVGTDKGSWDSYDPACYDNVITNCTFGPGVAAEHLDIKEGTRRTIVEYCTFNGTGITGENSATTYVSCKGVDAEVRYNTGYRNGNVIIDSAFSCNNRGVEDSGTGNWFYYNMIYHDDAESWVVRTKQGTCTYKVWSNTRNPEGNMYQTYTGSSYAEVDPGVTETPVPTLSSGDTPVPTGMILLGDVDGDGDVDIVDALLTAQYYVGLNPVNFSSLAADVDIDGGVDIVDALLIAQYYVGLISEF